MTRVERIALIDKLATELARQSWPKMNHLLRVCGFTTDETLVQLSDEDYARKMLEKGEQIDLIELSEYLNISIDKTKNTETASFWINNYFKLFISHLANHKNDATDLKEKLEYYGISSFVAHEDIIPTKKWQDEIELALSTCDSLTALMVKEFNDSNWTDQEIGFVFGRGLLIIPVRMGKDPYGFIGKFQAITFKDIDSLADDIIEILVTNEKTQTKMASSILWQLNNAYSYQHAKNLIYYVEKINCWDKKLKKLLEISLSHSQVKSSFGVPSRINSILSNIKHI